MKNRAYTKKTIIFSGILLVIVLISIIVIGGSAGWNNRSMSPQNSSSLNFTAKDTFSFSDLQPTQQMTYSDDVIFSENTEFKFTATWTRSGLPLEVGLLAQDGKEYATEIVGGSVFDSIKDVPAGTYQIFVRNSESNLQVQEQDKMNVTGAIGFDY